jgi:hypothetical protein
VWLSFFLAQVPLIIAERLAYGALKRRGVLLPDWLRTAMTVVLVVVTGQHLFWQPTKRYGVAAATIANVQSGMQAALARLGIPLPS